MAEKSAAKKDHGKNKKFKQNDKKKSHENGVKHLNEQSVHYSNNVSQKKKEKNLKNNGKSAGKKKSGLLLKGFLKMFLAVFLFLGFLYIIDYERFVQIKTSAGVLLNKAVAVLPDEVTSKGKTVVEFVSPVAVFVFEKFKLLQSHTLNFLNTNSIVKEHWINIREISSITSSRVIEYIRTLYFLVMGVFQSGKK